eukprot:Awhi_evm1s7905
MCKCIDERAGCTKIYCSPEDIAENGQYCVDPDVDGKKQDQEQDPKEGEGVESTNEAESTDAEVTEDAMDEHNFNCDSCPYGFFDGTSYCRCDTED